MIFACQPLWYSSSVSLFFAKLGSSGCLSVWRIGPSVWPCFSMQVNFRSFCVADFVLYAGDCMLLLCRWLLLLCSLASSVQLIGHQLSLLENKSLIYSSEFHCQKKYEGSQLFCKERFPWWDATCIPLQNTTELKYCIMMQNTANLLPIQVTWRHYTSVWIFM